VNDVPEILQRITYLRVKEDETWIIDLDDYFEDVEDKDNLTFTCNKEDIIIDPVTHEARWERNGKNSLKDVVFTASDGEASVSMEEVNLKVVETFNWLWMIVAAIFGALGVFVYRELRYRYKVEEAFLLNNAGIILTHLSKGESKMVIDVELVGAMLTAVRDFVKDSFSDNEKDSDVIVDKKRSLEKLEFGGFHLVLEQGNSTCLCAVISGYVNKRLRKRMKTVVGEFESKYAVELQDWDGMVETFEEAQAIIAELFKLGSRTEQLKSSLNVIREVVDEDYEMAFEEMSISEPIEEVDSGKEEKESKDDFTSPPS